MEPITNPKVTPPTARSLASLKIVSRLLAHELHAQASAKQVSLSKDEVVEVQTCIDLFIEEATRRQSASPALNAPISVGTFEPQLVSARIN